MKLEQSFVVATVPATSDLTMLKSVITAVHSARLLFLAGTHLQILMVYHSHSDLFQLRCLFSLLSRVSFLSLFYSLAKIEHEFTQRMRDKNRCIYLQETTVENAKPNCQNLVQSAGV